MRRCTLTALLVLLAGAAPAQAACLRPGERVVARSARVVVTAAPSGDARRWVGCLRAGARRTLLLRGVRGDDAAEVAEGFRISGNVVAWVRRRSDRYGSAVDVAVADLRTGERHRSEPFFQALSARTIEDLAVDRRGRAVFLEHQLRRTGVWALERGKLRLLDRGPAGAVGALRLERGVAVWRRGRAAFGARDRCTPRAASGTAEVAVGRTQACLRASGARVALGGRPLDALGPFVAVLRGDGEVHVLDVRDATTRVVARAPDCRVAGAVLDRTGAATLECRGTSRD